VKMEAVFSFDSFLHGAITQKIHSQFSPLWKPHIWNALLRLTWHEIVPDYLML
jgi:hypothetical protein